MLRAFVWQVVFLITALSLPVSADPIPVSLQKTDNGWQLLRGGEPYFIRGAGGDASMELLAKSGANSVRTWSVEGAKERLDQAHALGLTVTLGIWMGHERHGFDYSDSAQVAQQLADAERAVNAFKDHPALLLWAVGNEMEGFADGDNKKIWQAVNQVAAMIKKVDPLHPTMTVTADIGGERVHYVHEYCSAIDIHGINSYGGALSISERLRDNGATKPYVLTEFGPLGSWEAAKTEWGAPIEQTSGQKADYYRLSYQKGVQQTAGQALGSYVFLWGHKVEATSTWFGMFLEDGSQTASVATMAALWSEQDQKNFFASVEPLKIKGGATRQPNDQISVSTTVTALDRTSLSAQWALRPESGDYLTGGDFRRKMPTIEGAIQSSAIEQASVKLPREPGAYRLFYWLRNDQGHVATANIPLLIEGEPELRFPVDLYQDGFEGMPWAPSGWMGNTNALAVDGKNSRQVKEGEHSIRMRYEGQFGWVGVAWQNPPNNWGDLPGGYDLTGATALELWVRGAYGGEKIGIGVGIIESNKPHADSAIEKLDEIKLTGEWQQLRIPLNNADLSSIKTGFVITISGRQSPVTVCLDSIRYVK